MNETLLPAARPIDPARCYDEADIVLELGWTSTDLKRAREQGLRYKELSRGKRVYLGRCLLDWLGGDNDADR